MATNKYYFKDLSTNVHSDIFPSSIRMLIVGKSGSGKTCLLMRMLLEKNFLNYDKLYVFCRSLNHQQEYKVLQAGFENGLRKEDMIELLDCDSALKKHSKTIDDLANGMREYNDENDIEPSEIEAVFSNNGEDIPDPVDLDTNVRNLMIFDDIMTDKKQTLAESYYVRGRSANCDAIYLSQNYTHLPLHTIRTNANFMIFFKSDPKVVRQLFDDFASVDMSIEDFKKFCKDAWTKKYGFIVIDTSRDFESRNKYRKQLELER